MGHSGHEEITARSYPAIGLHRCDDYHHLVLSIGARYGDSGAFTDRVKRVDLKFDFER